MFTRTILLAGIAIGGLAASFAGAQAASSGVMDCRAHDWLAFGEAVEAQDNDALRDMLSLPELANCQVIVRTIEVMLCDVDPGACAPVVIIPPYIPPTSIILITDDAPPPSPPPGPFPGQRPGEQLGIERSDNGSGGDGSDSGDSGDSGGGSGGGGAASPAGGAPGARG